MHSTRLTTHATRAWLFGLLIAVLIVIAAFALGPQVALAQTQPAGQPMPPSPEYDAAQVTIPLSAPIGLAGDPIFQQNCAPCHGEQGLGNGPTAQDLSGPPTAFADAAAMREISPAQMFFTTKFGRMQKMMPPWRNQLDDGQIWDAVAFAWSLRTNEPSVAAGKELYDASCASCHGAMGKGDGPEAEGTLQDFSDQRYAIFKSQADWQKGWDAEHPQLGAEWSAEDRDNVLEYMRTFSYLPPWESPYKPGEGVITGALVQGTANGAGVAGLPVVLEAFVGFNQVAVFTSTAGVDGGYRFENLATDPSIAYLASTESDGISYSSNFVTLSPITPTLESQVAVFGTTDDPAGLRINRTHWIIDHQPGALIVGEIYTFGNDSDRTYIGRQIEGMTEPGTIELSLPAGAEEITFDNGALGNRFQQVGDKIYDTLPVVPGSDTRQIIVRYAIPYKGAALDMKQNFAYPVDQLSLMVADLPQLTVEASDLESVGTQDIQGQGFQIWRKTAFQPQAIELKMDGLLEEGGADPRAVVAAGSEAGDSSQPLESAAPQMEPWVPWVIVALVAAGLLAAIGLALRRGGMAAAYSRQDLTELRESLLDQIAVVDDRHAAGELGDADWATQRAYLKAQLVDVMQRQQGKVP
jgi:mono/diheme cytochrome c family protein